MPTESFDMPDPLQSVEAAVPEAPVEAPESILEQPLEAEPETIPFKHRREEIPLPAQALRDLAAAFGYEGPEAIVNQLQVARDAQTLYRQARDYYEQGGQRQQAPPPPPPVEQRWQQHVQREAPQYRPPAQGDAEPDPFALLQAMDRRTQKFEQYIDHQVQQSAWERQRQENELAYTATSEYDKFAKELKAQGFEEYKIPNMDYMIHMADRYGMLGSNVPIPEVYRDLHKIMFSDDYAALAVRKAAAKLRDPKARVPAVPAGPAATPAPRQQANALDGMTLKDLLPDGKY